MDSMTQTSEPEAWSPPEIYVCIDVETDGPVPGKNSMLSLAAAAYIIEHGDKRLVDSFSMNLEDMPGCQANKGTMREFWDKEPAAWQHVMHDRRDPETAMRMFVSWVYHLEAEHQRRAVAAAYPTGFDLTWVDHYLRAFSIISPFGFSRIDMKTLAMAWRVVTGKGINYQGWSRQSLPERFFDGLSHTHVALDDAIEQGAMMCNMLIELKRISEFLEEMV